MYMMLFLLVLTLLYMFAVVDDVVDVDVVWLIVVVVVRSRIVVVGMIGVGGCAG